MRKCEHFWEKCQLLTFFIDHDNVGRRFFLQCQSRVVYFDQQICKFAGQNQYFNTKTTFCVLLSPKMY